MIRSINGRLSRRVQGWSGARLALRLGLAAGVTALFLGLLSRQLATLDTAAVSTALTTVTLPQWVLALGATALSFWAVGQYDATLHRHLSTGESEKPARRAGMAAIALGQTLGLGVLTGALVRWRMLPDLSLIAASKLSAAVTLSFLFGWSMITALVFLLLPTGPATPLAAAVVLAGGAVCLLCLIAPRLRIAGRMLAFPNIFTTCRILLFSLVDTVAACAALWLLCPPDLALPFAALLPAYLLALGAGLISGTPGGVGAFEMTLLAALPAVPQPDLIAAVLAFRMVYYALPATLAAAAALATPMRAAQTAPPARLLACAPAEAGLLAQNQLDLHSLGPATQAIAARTPHALVMLLDPFGDATRPSALHAFHRKARAAARVPCLYKCSARMAVAARAAGWHVAPVAAEAWLFPQHFTLATPARAALRRKLRKAAQAGVQTRALGPADWPALPAIAAAWAAANGGERGFSMGRFDPGYAAQQRLFGAFVGGELLAFVSFHHNAQEWVLDLMRLAPGTPDGTAYALIVQALEAATGAAIPRLSLAAAPRLPEVAPPLRRLVPTTARGLCQFKASFAPLWQPLYIAAPNRAALSLAGAEIYRAIHNPPPLQTHCPASPPQFGFASPGQPWQTGAK